MVGALCAGAVAAVVFGAGAGAGVGAGAGTAATDGYTVAAEGRFAPPTAFIPSAAVTYDQKLVPAASWIRVRQRTGPGGVTTVDLSVTGFRPGQSYGAYVHQRPCGASPADAGGRYQNRPGADTAQAGPDNEVRLDFTADAKGAGRADVRHDWGFRQGEAASVVIQDRPGAEGVRVACFTVPFGWVTGLS
ncbi:superoxide dismutase family protein [Streptomyces sp. NBC_00820]|uniref:superoxide dismutase family protein n=1 Tax=Streptomyces sp. NBC_00820 TaxID=2975842 RepID=UPI002ED4FF75|nr:superoxide dismutase family protein [Streptomyces sp. NBC_00820]